MAAESRPCYRCVSHMYAHGIKRVFWTNSEGRWESAKVRNLVDLLEGGVSPASDGAQGSDGSDAGSPPAGLFVTRHEVLMLRRTIEAGGWRVMPRSSDA